MPSRGPSSVAPSPPFVSKKKPVGTGESPPGEPKTPVLRVATDEEVQSVQREADRLFEGATDVDHSLSMYLRELRKYPVLKPEEEQSWARKALSGDVEAQQVLIHHNTRFVVTMAKQYANKGVPLEDLIQEGNIGLMKAVKKFDPEFGVKFISYAVYWIGQSIRHALSDHQRVYRLPPNRATQLARIHRVANRIAEETGSRPSDERLAEETQIPLDMVKTLLKAKQADVSLDSTTSPDGGEGGIPLAERLAGETGTEEVLDERFRKDAINRVLADIRPRDQKILRLFFGLDAGREHTLEEIGMLLGVTRERIRQLRDRALRELRQSAEAPELKDLY